MKHDNVAIIGAGPSGLVAAKECLERGLNPVIFEKTGDLGGVWNPARGKVWSAMRTNVSHFHMGFSDHAWAADMADFPNNRDVYRYLNDYAETFRLTPYINCNQAIHSVTHNPSRPVPWHVGVGTCSYAFDKVILASGVFGAPHSPDIKNADAFQGDILHSGAFKTPDDFANKRITVVGGSFSAYEIASRLADVGVETTHVFRKPLFVAQRYISQNGCRIPLDVSSYVYPAANGPVLTVAERRNKKIDFLTHHFGNPGDTHPALFVETKDAHPIDIVISDDYLDHVRHGTITPYRTEIDCFEKNGLLLSSGQCVTSDTVIFCTGFQADLPLLDDTVKQAIQYDPSDRFQPMILNKGVFHPDFPDLAFAGLYRGPFFGVMEMQARWIAAVFSGEIAYPDAEASQRGLAEEQALRALDPRPAFPRPNYVELMREYGTELGVLPNELIAQAETTSVPMSPSDFRRNGIGENREIAEQQRNRLMTRLAP